MIMITKYSKHTKQLRIQAKVQDREGRVKNYSKVKNRRSWNRRKSCIIPTVLKGRIQDL